MYTVAPTGKSCEELYALLFNKAARGSQNTKVKVRHWSRTVKGFLQAFRGKEEDARAEVEAFMEYCAEVADKRGHLPAKATTTLA